MEIKRKRTRLIVDLFVTLTTVLDSIDARIVDLSENGAQIMGASMPTGTKFQIEYQDQTIYAQCMWSEIDRMGVRFPFAITDGPLREALLMAIPMDQDFLEMDDHSEPGGFMPPPPRTGSSSARRMGSTNFGRRNIS